MVDVHETIPSPTETGDGKDNTNAGKKRKAPDCGDGIASGDTVRRVINKDVEEDPNKTQSKTAETGGRDENHSANDKPKASQSDVIRTGDSTHSANLVEASQSTTTAPSERPDAIGKVTTSFRLNLKKKRKEFHPTLTQSGQVTTIHLDDLYCHECDKMFSKAKMLKQHKRVHTGNLLKCRFCGKEFVYDQRYAVHMRRHKGILPFMCDTCGERFPEKPQLRKHSLVHSTERPHKCSVCGKGYKHKYIMRKHERKHTERKMYTCRSCDEEFAFRSERRCHEKNAHRKKRRKAKTDVRKKKR